MGSHAARGSWILAFAWSSALLALAQKTPDVRLDVGDPPGVAQPPGADLESSEETRATMLIVLAGLVVAPDGSPAEGAIVVSSAGGQAVADRNGRYRLEVSVAAGVHRTEVTAVGAASGSLQASASVELSAAAGTVRVPPLTLTAGTCQPGWLPTFGAQPGVDDEINALAVFDDGTGPALYVGGNFDFAGSVLANEVAKWDGSTWSALGSGISSPGGLNDFVSVLGVFDLGSGPALYAGGRFTSAGGVAAKSIAKWDGSSWSPLGSGLGTFVSDGVDALAVFDDGSGPALYAGGDFANAGGVAANYIAKWDGSTWSAVGSGTSWIVHSLAVFDDGGGPALYVGGRFGAPASRIARWDGSSWSSLGSGTNGPVNDLAVFDDGEGAALYAGGQFDMAGGIAASRIAKWNGSSWSPLGSGLDRLAISLSIFDDGSGPALYAGGSFTTAGGAPASYVARWDGSSWSPLGSGVDDTVVALAVFDDGSGPALVAGGSFKTAGGVGVVGVATWKSSTWSALGRGLNDAVLALEVFDDGGGAALYAAGRFTGAGGAGASRIARWDGSSWSPLGTGLSGVAGVSGPHVTALTVFDDGGGAALYAGGEFSTAGGVAASNIARWDGSSWSALGSGLDDSVHALTVFDDGGGPALYVAGDFSSPGGVARWDGSTWSAVGNPMNTFLRTLSVFDDGNGPALYAGGRNVGASGVPVACWNGSTWSPLGGWTSGGDVNWLAVHDDGSGPALYVGGSFAAAAGVPASNIASWDGLAWSSLGTGTNSSVERLAMADDGNGPALYAGGNFTIAGGIAAQFLAKWDGSTWSPLGIGTFDPPTALAAFDRGGPSLYVGATRFAKGDSFLGRWGCIDLTPPTLSCPPAVIALDHLGTSPGETVTFTVTAEDELDPAPSVVCSPPSGSVFPFGTTMVTCTAIDRSGNEATCDFPVTVRKKLGQPSAAPVSAEDPVQPQDQG
jgi:hypothetical protein